MAFRITSGSLAMGLLVAATAGCFSSVDLGPRAPLLAPDVEVVVGLPVSIAWGGPVELRRIQRRTSDSLLAATGGSAVIAEELGAGEAGAGLAPALRALGEDASRALTLALSVRIGGRREPGVSPIPGFLVGSLAIIDYRVHVEVRSAATGETVGSVDTIASGRANDPEVGPRGERRAAMQAIDEALRKTIRAFAPRLARAGRPFDVAEDSAGPAASLTERLSRLAELYPELSVDEMEALALSTDSLLVLEPGPLRALGLLRGDLLWVPRGAASSARAALARAVSRGAPPTIEVDRQGQHYLLAVLAPDGATAGQR